MFGLVYWTNPDGRREALPRAATLPATAFNPVDMFEGRRGRLAAAHSDEHSEEDSEEEE